MTHRCIDASTLRFGPSGIDHRDISDLEFTLDEDEQEEGLALICMAYPVAGLGLAYTHSHLSRLNSSVLSFHHR